MPAVFISYSRRDYYFAESLAFHLAERGIANWLDANHLTPGGEWAEEIDRALDEAQTVVLVVTAASVRSEYVRREWQRALAQGDRLILALFRSCKLPPELEHARVVDFRGAFRPALQRLTHLLGRSREAAPRLTSASGLPRVPPWVGLMTLMLASVFLLPLIVFGDWKGLGFEDESIGLRIFTLIMLPVVSGVVVWHACLAFLWRRMGMTRLALTLTLFTAIFGFTLLGRTEWISTVTALAGAMHYNGIPTPILTSIVGIGCAALAIVLFLRPKDLLRWCPTGKAWDSYRRGRVMKIPDLPTRFAEVGRFQLLHDMEDAPAAAQLRADLILAGAVEARSEATRVILLTNRTTTAWLSQQAELLEKGVVTVIGSAIGLPKSLQWLWRRQWIDLRRWDATRKRRNPVPAVPEGMNLLRIPASVRVSEHLLCAMAGLLGVLANIAFSPDSSKSEALMPRDWFGVVIAVACSFWIVAAWQLIHRTITRLRYARWVGLLSWLTIILAAGALYFFVSLGGNGWRTAPAGVFVLALPFFLRRQTPRLAFWFPAPPAPGTKIVQRLNAPRKWEALLWAFVYMGFWMFLLGVQDW
jgi:hypothetical protein